MRRFFTPAVKFRGLSWALAVMLAANCQAYVYADEDAASLLRRLGVDRGVCVVLGAADGALPLELARKSELLLYVQSEDAKKVAAVRQAAAQAGLLGTRVFVHRAKLASLSLADNLADGLIVVDAKQPDLARSEILRVLRPHARALLGKTTLTKPRPEGADDWSHPYHGPDNNPQSRDALAKPPFLTQFLAEPWYVPMPQVSVVSGGRMFKAFGHIALKQREWPWLNSLVAINAYNGTHLWKRPLQDGFMVHRNTLIATPEIVYLADDVSCKLLDAATGKLRGEIVIPRDVDAAGVWKWMALSDGVLYALVGEKELRDTVIRGGRTQAGWPWSGLGKAYGGKYPWGFGRTLLAMDPKTKRVLWTYKSSTPIDSRAVCLAAGRIFLYSHQKYLAAVDVKNGDEQWKTADAKLLAAIGEHDRAQTARKGFASTTYAKANDKGVYFAGPQRTRLVAVSARDGSLMWQYPHGNFQLVLRQDGLYALGRMQTSKKFDYLSGKVLADLQCYRGNCTRATATLDSIFTRGYRHTGTMRLDLSSNRAEARRIPLMRPACQDGVIISNGLLYWGPWMCDCNHSLVGMISLAPAGDSGLSAISQQAADAERLEIPNGVSDQITPLAVRPGDWPGYRSGPTRQANSPATISKEVKRQWQFKPAAEVEPTAPVTAGGLVFWSGLDGVVRAAEVNSGKIRWTAYTGGAVRFPPEVWQGRLYVGSGDGWVYCLEAATGRTLWRFRAAPRERLIAVHGRLLSTWPVGSGVLVHQGVVYAAAGIASYDGTHVYALDAASGKIRWRNNTSGNLVGDDLSAGGQVTGVSVQGHLLLHKDRLYLAGGNVVSPAVYDTADGRCLNKLTNEWWKRPADAKEKFPSKPQTSMFQRSPRGRELFLVDGKVRVFDQLLYSPPKYGPSRYFGGNFLQANSSEMVIRAAAGRVVRLAPRKSGKDQPQARWEHRAVSEPRAMALCKNVVLIAGLSASSTDQKETHVLTAVDRIEGRTLWSHRLPAAPATWGLAVDAAGNVVVTLADGRVACYGHE